jgi:tungstate transport system ATP-binding protein
MSTMVSINNLLVQRSGRKVLEIDHLTIEQGVVLAVAGPNGAGKTTLLLVLARLLKPDQGEIQFNGLAWEEISDLNYRRRIGLVMQNSLLLNCSVFENIALILQFRRLPRLEVNKRTEEWLERLDLSHLRKRSASQLSGGEARRVALARAFAIQPDLLLLDEPFSALDRESRHKLQDDLKTIFLTTKTTTVFSTHSETDVQNLSNRKIELTVGRNISYD